MKKGFASLVLAGVMAAGLSISAFAAGWTEDAQGWRWLNDDGSYIANTWYWLDGNGDGISECYYFNPAGYLMTNSYIDGYQVNGDGCWIVDGVVQTKGAEAASGSQTETAGDVSEGAEDYRAMLKAAFDKAEPATSMDADITMNFAIGTEGLTLDMAMDGNMKIKDADSEDMQYLMDMNMSLLGQDMKTVMFYDDGYIYTDMEGMKTRQASDYAAALEASKSSTELLSGDDLDYIENVTGVRNADGTVTISYTMSGDKMNEIFNRSLQAAGTEETVGSITLGSCIGDAVIDAEGNIIRQSMSMDMDMVSEGVNIDYVIYMALDINSMGQPVEFTLPSKEGYTDVEAA